MPAPSPSRRSPRVMATLTRMPVARGQRHDAESAVADKLADADCRSVMRPVIVTHGPSSRVCTTAISVGSPSRVTLHSRTKVEPENTTVALWFSAAACVRRAFNFELETLNWQLRAKRVWRPQRDSNPRYRRERPASWASGRWGRIGGTFNYNTHIPVNSRTSRCQSLGARHVANAAPLEVMALRSRTVSAFAKRSAP
jgi:hypothetical protein